MGLHTGRLIMGIIGDEERTDAATISDTVNTASRMESLTKEFGASILLSGDVLRSIENEDNLFAFRYLGRVRVKGRKAPVEVYECLNGEPEDEKRIKLDYQLQFEGAINHYTSQEFSQAIVLLEQMMLKNSADKVGQYFLDQAKKCLVEGIPENWAE